MIRKIPKPRLSGTARTEEWRFKAFLRNHIMPWPVQKRYGALDERVKHTYRITRVRIPLQRSRNIHQPIFIIGSSRSGTGMITRVLGACDELCYFSEDPLIRKYMLRIINRPAQRTRLMAQQKEAFLRLSGLRPNQRLLEKTPEHSLIMDELVRYYPNAQFIHILRNGRDCATSMLSHPWICRELARPAARNAWMKKAPWLYVDAWPHMTCWQRGLLRWAIFVKYARQGAELAPGRYIEIRYESICTHPVEHIQKILKALDLPYNDDTAQRIGMVQVSRINKWRDSALSVEDEQWRRSILRDFDLQDVESVN